MAIDNTPNIGTQGISDARQPLHGPSTGPRNPNPPLRFSESDSLALHGPSTGPRNPIPVTPPIDLRTGQPLHGPSTGPRNPIPLPPLELRIGQPLHGPSTGPRNPIPVTPPVELRTTQPLHGPSTGPRNPNPRPSWLQPLAVAGLVAGTGYVAYRTFAPRLGQLAASFAARPQVLAGAAAAMVLTLGISSAVHGTHSD